MDAKEKKDRADQTARRVYDILKNHDQEMSTIEAQILSLIHICPDSFTSFI